MERLAGQTDDALDKILRSVLRILQNDDITARGRLKTRAEFVDNEILAGIKGGLHRCAAHNKRLGDKKAHGNDYDKGNNGKFEEFGEKRNPVFPLTCDNCKLNF